VFLTLLLVVALARALRSERLVDDLLAGGAAGAIIATKETFPLAIGSVLAGMILSGTEARALFRPKRIAIAMAAALFVAGAFYSHGFTDPAGLLSPVQAVRIWGARAEAGEGHRKPWWYFLMLLAREEAPIVAAAIAGTVAAARRRQGLGIWAAVWGATTLVAYSAFRTRRRGWS